MTNSQIIIGNLLSAAIMNKKFTGRVRGIDWVEIFEFAQIHQVQALLYSVVKDIPQEDGGPDKDLLEIWKNVSLIHTVNQVLLRNQAREIMLDLSEGDIPAVLVKGPVIQDMYPKPEYRTMADLDILIQSEYIEHAVSVLQKIGYTKQGHDCKHIELSHVDHIPVELHTKLSKDHFTESVQEWEKTIWQRIITDHIDGVPVLTLTEVDHFLYLCLHMANHFISTGFGIRQLCDLAVFVERKRDSLKWEVLLSHAKTMGIQDFITALFRACRVLFEIGNPHYSDYTHEEQAENMIQKLINDIFTGGVFGNHDTARFISGKYLTFLRSETTNYTEPRRIKRLRYLLFPPFRIISCKYNYIQKLPFLTPVAWAHRIIAILLGKNRSFKLKDYGALFKSQKIYEERFRLLRWLRLI